MFGFKPLLTAALGLAGFSAPVAATARDWPSAEGWDVVESDGVCGIAMTYSGKGSSELIVMLRPDGGVALQLTNTGWSASENERYDITWSFDEGGFTGPALGVGTPSDIRRGFFGKFDTSVLTSLERSTGLQVRRGDTVVDDLSLKGSAAALRVAKRCLAAVKSDLEQARRERERFAHIADDPFADSPGEKAPLQPNFPTQLGADAYPAEARAAGVEGSVRVRAVFGADGSVKDCAVLGSSGSRDLDETTCRVIRNRVRVAAEAGRADVVFEHSVRWAL